MARVEPYRRRFDRRAFLAAALGALGAPLAVRAQPAAATVHRIGILANVPLSNPNSALLWGEFVRALRDLGHVDGQNVAIDYVSSDGQYERLPALAAGLVQRKAEVIVAPAVQNVLAAKQATRTIPIVMTSVGDPVGNGLVASLARPGGNVTGTSFQTSATVGKQLELLKQIAPQASKLGVLLNPQNPGHSLAMDEARTSARTLNVQVQAERAREPADLDRAFGAMVRKGVGAIFIPWDGTFLVHLTRIVQLAARSRLPALYGQRGYVDAGGLASYGPSALESFRRAATYVDKILKGASPADLPVEQPTKFELVVNLETARALGLTIPPALLAQADQVIE